MYSDKTNINLLTALLVAYGVRHAVVCPGSRNAPIVHNMEVCPDIRCYPVTDERSAGFYALGLALHSAQPVAVCVTSGTALLNLSPAVAEAAYRHLSLVVISADRPAAWIDQLDGQTLVQPGAFGTLVRCSVSLPEPHDDTERWHCRRLVCEALYRCTYRQPAPVHINVPVTEPLFAFTTPQLPAVSAVGAVTPPPMTDSQLAQCYAPLISGMSRAHRPMIVVGQLPLCEAAASRLAALSDRVVTLCEPLSCTEGGTPFDEVLHALHGCDGALRPDRVVYLGDTVVSKRLRRFLRESGAPTCLLTADGSRWADPTMHLTEVAECSSPDEAARLLTLMAQAAPADDRTAADRQQFAADWHEALECARKTSESYDPPYSQMAAVKYFEEQTDDLDGSVLVHYANSSAIRLANIYARHYVWCNRGVNGIEGSLSTAAGFSLLAEDDSLVFCIIGDLSFFYDQNALWNRNLNGRLRIILLNNRCGGIFRQLKGLGDSPAAGSLVEANHRTEAQGICTQNDIGYLSATDTVGMQTGIVTLLTRRADRPMLLEVFTDADADAGAVAEYYRRVKERLADRTYRTGTTTDNTQPTT